MDQVQQLKSGPLHASVLDDQVWWLLRPQELADNALLSPRSGGGQPLLEKATEVSAIASKTLQAGLLGFYIDD